MEETWDRKLEYDPFVQFKERAFAGKWVNIDKNGFPAQRTTVPGRRTRVTSTSFSWGAPASSATGLATTKQSHRTCRSFSVAGPVGR